MLLSNLVVAALAFAQVEAAPLNEQRRSPAISKVGKRFSDASGRLNLAAVDADISRTKAKYGRTAAAYRRKAAKRSNNPYAVLNAINSRSTLKRAANYAVVALDATFATGTVSTYRSNVSIGTPEQEFPLTFDTGSPDLWIPGLASDDTTYAEYNPQSSSTSKDVGGQFVEQYGLGAVSGSIYSDVVTVGNLSVQNQLFGVADQLTSNFESTLASAGLLGLSFSTLSNSFQDANWIEALALNGSLASPLFSTWLGAAEDFLTSPSQIGIASGAGELCIGCVNSARYTGNFISTPLVFPGYWEVYADGISVGGSSISGASTYAAIDTGTSLFYVTPELFQSMAASNGFGTYSLSQSTTILTIPCSEVNGDFSVNMAGGGTVNAKLEYFVLGAIDQSGQTCGLGIAEVEGVQDPLGNSMSIFGDIFMQSFVTVFSYANNGTVAFANAVAASPAQVSITTVARPPANTDTPFGSATGGSTFTPTISQKTLPALTESATTFTVTASATA